MKLFHAFKPTKASKPFSFLFTFLILFSLISPLLALSSKAQAAGPYLATDSGFSSATTYVRENNHGDVAAQIKAPAAATEIRFTINNGSVDDIITDADTTDNAYSRDIYKIAGAPAGYQWWRLQTDLLNGQYNVTAEFNDSGVWYPVTGSETLYSIDLPAFSYVTPATSGIFFRPTDQFARVNIDDQFNQFLSVTFVIFNSTTNIQVGPNYTVNRADCDLRSAGNYIICDLMRDFTGAKPVLAEGSYYVKIQSDTIPHTGVRFTHANSKSNTFTIDSTRPSTSSLTIETTGPIYADSIVTSVNATDNNGVVNVRFYITTPRADGQCDGNGTALLSQTVSSPDIDGKYRTTLNTSSLNGDYCINAIAEDVANSHSNPIERAKIQFDNVAPTIAVNNLITNDTTPALTGTVSDINATIDITVDGNSYTGINNGDGTWSLVDDVISSLADGVYNITAEATDSANNQGQDTTTNELTIDTTAPIVNAGPDLNINTTTQLNANVNANISGLKTLEWSVISGTGTITFDDKTILNPQITADAEGQYTLRLTATDNAGNTGSDELVITIDTTAPILTEITPIGTYVDGFGNRYTRDNTPDYIFNSNEAGTISYQGTCSSTTTTATSSNNTIVFNALTDGVKNNCVISVTDSTGNVGTLNVTPFIIDTTAPTLAWNGLTNGAHLKGTLTLSAEASDVLSGVNYVRFRYRLPGTTTWSLLPADYSAPYSAVIDTTTLSDGSWQFGIGVIDFAGNTNQVTYNITVDNHAPSISFTDDVAAGPVQSDSIAILAVDPNMDATSLKYAFTLEICDENTVFTESYTNSEAIALTEAANGYYVCVKASDMAGNTSYLRSANPVNLDNEKPTIDTIEDQSFDEGEMVNLGILNEKGVADNKGLDKIYVNFTYTDLNGDTDTDSEDFDVSGAGWDGLGGTLNELYEYWTESAIDFSAIILPIDTSLFEEGTYEFSYYVTDIAGNRSDCDIETSGDQNCSFRITINNVDPVLTLNQNQTIEEGSAANFTASFTDPSYIPNINSYEFLNDLRGEETYEPDDSSWEIDVDYGDGVFAAATSNLPGEFSINPHIYANSGTYTVRVQVCETTPSEIIPMNALKSEGKCDTASVIVTVTNAAPTVNITATPGNTATAQAITMSANIAGLNAPITIVGWASGNFAGCTGNANTVTTPSTPGTYHCTVTVRDADGDESSATKSVTVVAAATNNTGGNNNTNGQGDIQGVSTSNSKDTETPGTSESPSTPEPQILGESKCDNESKISGFVYVDTNDNSKKDKDEKGLEGITLKIYTKDADKKLISKTETDKNGYWETKACPGEYNVEIDKDDISNSYKLDENEVKGLTVKDDQDSTDVNFKVAESDSSYLWLICLIPLLMLVLGGGMYYYTQKRTDKLKLNE